MHRRITRADPLGRYEHSLYRSNDGNTVVAGMRQDIEPILEENLSLRNQRSGFKGDLQHVASIPLAVYERLMKEGIAQDEDRFKAWLNDSYNEPFRTLKGKI